MGELHELLGVALERVGRQRGEGVGQRGLGPFQEALLLLEALSFGFNGRGKRFLLSRALEDRLLMAKDGLLAILERLLQVRYALRQGLKGGAAAGFDAQLVEGRYSFLVDVLEAAARFPQHLFGLRGSRGS
jgi:hypothetical protein